MAPPRTSIYQRLLLHIFLGLLGFCLPAFAAAPTAPSGVESNFTCINQTAYAPEYPNYWKISWVDNSTNENGFTVNFRINTGGGWVDGGSPWHFTVDSATSASSGTVLTVTLPLSSRLGWYSSNGSLYPYPGLQWFVTSFKSNTSAPAVPTESSTAAYANAYGSAPGPQTPVFTAPSNLVMTPTGDGTYQMTFSDNSNCESQFELQFKKTTDTAWPAAGVGIGFNTPSMAVGGYLSMNGPDGVANTSDDYVYFVPNFPPGTSYDFRIRAIDFNSNTTAWSNTYTATTQALKPPTTLVATRTDEASYKLTFQNVSSGESGYHFQYRAQGTSTWNDFTTSNGSTYYVENPYFNEIPFSGFAPKTVYEFQVRAFVRNSQTSTAAPTVFSAFSNTATGAATGFNAPTNLAGTSAGDGLVNLTWTDNSTVEGNFEVQARVKNTTSPNNWVSLYYNSNSTTTGSASNVQVVPGLTYQFQIRATYGSAAEITSDFSNMIEVTTPFTPPTNLTATATSPSTISFTWTDNTNAETEYALLYRKQGDTSFSTRKYISANSGTAPNSMSLSQLPEFDPGTIYEFQISAVYSDSSGNLLSSSTVSNTATVTTPNGFSSKPYAPITMGVPFSYQMATKSQQSRTSWSVSNLPTGLSFDSGTGVISGTPTVAGVFTVPMTATFADGSTNTTNLVLRIRRPGAAPQIASAISTQVLAPSGSSTVALGSSFSDPDTDEAVRMVTSKGTLDIILYSSLTPSTVTNFKAYNYASTFFHRAPTDGLTGQDFVLQGGGYSAVESPDVFESITRQAAVVNEPGISNLNNTIAMAKVGDDPNSATSEFFFNRQDNSSNLDNQNGGFTVFGRVSDATASVLNTIGALPTGNYSVKLRTTGGTTPTSANFSFSDVPMDTSSSTAPTTIDQSLLVKVVSVTNLPVLTYSIATPPDGAIATASINGTDLQILAVGLGSTSVVVKATDVDGNTTNQTVNINVSKLPAVVTLDSATLSQTYNGSARVVTATTTPADLPLIITYDGSTTAPTNAGSYPVTASVNSASYAGSVSGTLVVSKANASLTLSGLSQAYDGTPKTVGTTTNPAGLGVSVTYAGSATAPSALGSYAVVATISDTNYQGSKSDTLVIRGQQVTEWVNQYFTPQQVHAGLSADDADPDGDGIPNLMEYALGSNPGTRNSGLSEPVRDANGLTLTFTRPKDLPNVVYSAVSSDDMSTWYPLTLEVINDGAVQTIRVRDPLSSGNANRRFIRLLFNRQ